MISTTGRRKKKIWIIITTFSVITISVVFNYYYFFSLQYHYSLSFYPTINNNSNEKNSSSFPCGAWIPNILFHNGVLPINLSGDDEDYDSIMNDPNTTTTDDYDNDDKSRLTSLLQHDIPRCTRNNSDFNVVGKELNDLPFHKLYCRPNVTTFNRAAPILALDLKLSSKNQRPEYSIISPSYHVAPVLRETAPTLCQYTTGLWEVIFILDGCCYDDSLQILRNILLSPPCIKNDNNNNNGLVRARVVINPTEVFETSSDNIGFLLAEASHFIIEIQSDMILQERGWNRDLSRPFFEYDDIFSISGRCGQGDKNGHNYFYGRCDENIEHLDFQEKEIMKDAVWIVLTSNRGPLMYRADALKALGYYDEVNFMLGDDDHDLNRRANFRGWVTAYKYVHFYSPLHYSPVRNYDKYIKNKLPDSIKEYRTAYKEYRKMIKKENTCSNTQVSPNRPKIQEYRKLSNYSIVSNLNAPLPPLPDLVMIDTEKQG